jgi:hypothetical protein
VTTRLQCGNLKYPARRAIVAVKNAPAVIDVGSGAFNLKTVAARPICGPCLCPNFRCRILAARGRDT